MSLITCSKCGNQISNTSQFCSHCGNHISRINSSDGYSFVTNPSPTTNQNNSRNERNTQAQDESGKIKCPVCGSGHVDITFVQMGASTMTREPGVPTKVARKAMKASTIGLWGLTGKRTGYSSTAFHNQKMALCKDCGHSWAFYTSREKESSKTMLIIIGSILCVLTLFLLFPSLFFNFDDKDSSTAPPKNVQSTEVNNSNALDGFLYEISGDEILLQAYEGETSLLEVFSTYDIDGVTYKTNTENIFISSSTVNTLILHEGITEIYMTAFNSSNVKSVFFPSSMGLVYDYTLDYLRPDEGEQIQIYFAGTEEEWNNVFTHYERTKVEDAISEGDAEEIGTSIGDKINELISGEYDSSLFNYHFSAEPNDVVANIS